MSRDFLFSDYFPIRCVLALVDKLLASKSVKHSFCFCFFIFTLRFSATETQTELISSSDSLNYLCVFCGFLPLLISSVLLRDGFN